jgi:hypothetical protein
MYRFLVLILSVAIILILSDRAQLAADAEIIDAILLAVLGYGDEVDVHMPLNAVAADTYVPT